MPAHRFAVREIPRPSTSSGGHAAAQALYERLLAAARHLLALRAQVDALTRQLAQANVQPAAVDPAAAAGAANSARLLKAKEQALDLKSRLMRRLGGEGK